jgi:hypothetical protein
MAVWLISLRPMEWKINYPAEFNLSRERPQIQSYNLPSQSMPTGSRWLPPNAMTIG